LNILMNAKRGEAVALLAEPSGVDE
jgi:hypothetical protein